MKLFFNTCPRDCYDTCSIVTAVDEGKLIEVKANSNHPITQGYLCPKGQNLIKYVYHKDRVLYPLRRTGSKGEGKFKKISWDDALNEIASRLTKVINENGSKTVLHYDYGGHSGLISLNFPKRFFNAIGSAETTYSICDNAGELAVELHYGKRYGRKPEEMLKSKLIVYWGFNAAVSNLHNFGLAKQAKEKGTKIYVIDPIANETTRLGTHLRIRPATDVIFAFGIAKYLIDNELIDSDFINEHTHGFEDFKGYLSKYTTEYVSKHTGISTQDIKSFAVDYAALKPNFINIGYGLQKQINGGEIVRAICLLPALIGVPRGFYYCNSERDFDKAYLKATHLRPNNPVKYVSSQLGRDLISKEINFLFVYNANPAATSPNQTLVKKGLLHEDLFVVVHDLFLTDTTLYADIVLPAASFFETMDINISYWHYYLSLNQKAIEPIDEAKSNSEVFRLLAKKMGLSQPELFEPDEDVIKKLISTSKTIEGRYEDLLQKGFLRMKQLPLMEFQTKSGKIEFSSSRAQELGLSSFPIVLDEHPQFPLRLISSAHPLILHSQYFNIQSIKPYILVNPTDAIKRMIKNKDATRIFNERGSLVLPVKISENVPEGVIWTFRSPWVSLSHDKKNVNVLTNDDFQRSSYGSTFNSTFVELEKT
ncbi:molybdopterin-dependent oxidoreductase [Candidatus Borrarchaeum sp.]|uniref:molybdopterin-dependent oxidoreductase n=1 Tax=Candidatus Borrarchaeum sp. TaxID=2846742 RepID=UPI00257C3655|nr:molybdopterin-dependent oxidoreductase [Candidatus Borrarchaeum sp.]